MSEVTREQARAFIDSLIGRIPVGVADDEEVSRPKSEGARAHLEAVLGLGGVPGWYDMRQFLRAQEGEDDVKRDFATNVARVNGLLDYLEGVVRALRSTDETANNKAADALKQIADMVAADGATDADIADMFWQARAIARAAIPANGGT